MAPKSQQIIAGGLIRLLADTCVLLCKVRQLSSHLRREADRELAAMREDLRELDDAATRIALRIAALGREVPESCDMLARSASIKREVEPQADNQMIAQIASDHAQVLIDIETLDAALPLAEDDETAKLLVDLATCHQGWEARLRRLC